MRPGKDYIGTGCGAFIRNENSEVLLMKRGPGAKNEAGSWMLPGASVEYGEKLADAVTREIREELGIEIELTEQLPGWDHILPEEGQHWVTNIFGARITSGLPEIKEPEKCSEIGWFALGNLPSPIAKASQGAVTYFKSKN